MGSDHMVKVEEIKRILDDYDKKARQAHDIAEEYYIRNEFDLAQRTDEKAHAYEYCAAVLRSVIPSV